MPNNNACAKPCGGCPWLKKNQTDEAVRNSPQGGGWFDPENLRAKWHDIANKSHMLPCHETDPFADRYGGVASCSKKQLVCIGVSTLAFREVTEFMRAGNNFARYKKKRGKIAMSLLGLASWASRLLYAGAVLDIGERALEIPNITEDNADVGIP